MDIKPVAKKWLPPAVVSRLRPLLKRGIYFTGNYSDWASASAHASGYDSALILERVKHATAKVMTGEAMFERDSVLFEEVQYSFPVLAGLLRAAVENDNRLSVLDFGGSLGSSYFQCREFLSPLPSFKWGIVEQDHFVKCGREQFETEQLKFYYTITECKEQIRPNVVLLSSVLQYLPEPHAILNELISSDIPYIIIDRTPFSNNEDDRIAVQHVPPSIYEATYPLRIFGAQSLLKGFHGRYEMLVRFDCSQDGSAIANGLEFAFGGMVLRKI